ncbi:hypothetical protein PHYBOEH_001084 [Phytophthora boehmeriae]|uniref:M96 mating-specific protein family n=1 Tax=Phytophthora boehmeriae TaxID=109152 RepID=A0A8T1V7B9_9STRA|nr:hypothetical protein PHYBOEH_001084 [Phytophthora boehmeriae]
MSLHVSVDESLELNSIMELADSDDIELFADADAFVSSGEFDSSMFGLSPVARNFQNSTGDIFVNNTGSNMYTSQALRDIIASRKNELAVIQRKSRDRVKSSRESLRRQANELADKLARLKQVQTIKQVQADLNRPPKYLLWRQIAARELRERWQAEAERRRLTEFVDTQKAYIADLTDQARKWPSGNELRILTKKLRRNSQGDALYNAYIREVEMNYSRTDDVFLDCGMASLPERGAMAQSVKKRRDDGEVEYYELLKKFPKSSSFREAASTMWKLAETKFVSRDHHERYEVSMDPENTFAIKYSETKTLKTGEQVVLFNRFFLRRFVEPNRIVHVWKVVSEGTGAFRGVHFDQTGWNCIRPAADPTNTGSIVEMCQRWIPLRYRTSGSSEVTVGQFCEVLQDTNDKVFTDVVKPVD